VQKAQTSETKYLSALWLSIASAFWGCFAIASCIAVSISSGRGALPIMLAIPAVELGSAAVLIYRSANRIPCPSLDRGAEYIFVASVLTYVLVMFRLLLSSSFGGSAVNFNFGWDCKDGECIANLAFVFNFDSIMHILQGCLFFLLYRDILMGACPVSQITLQRCQFIKEFLGLGFWVYPSYSLIKRIDEASTFSICSHFNNVSEWACGFVIGACAIFPLYASLYSRYSDTMLSDSPMKFTVIPEKSGKGRRSTYFRICRIFGGVSLLMSFLVALILMLISWNKSTAEL